MRTRNCGGRLPSRGPQGIPVCRRRRLLCAVTTPTANGVRTGQTAEASAPTGRRRNMGGLESGSQDGSTSSAGRILGLVHQRNIKGPGTGGDEGKTPARGVGIARS